MTCRLCGGHRGRTLVAFGRFWQRCRECGSASLERPGLASPLPGSVEHLAGLPEPGPSSPESRARLQARASLLRRMAPGRRVLDLGAGHGDFVEEARGLGLAAEGIETREAARAIASGRGVALGSQHLGAIDAEFHAVTLWDVIAYEDDPSALIRAARRLLVPGGVMALTTANAGSLTALLLRTRYPLLDPARYGYLHQLSRQAVAALFDRAGLTLIHLETRGMTDLRQAARALLPRRTPGHALDWFLSQLSAALRPMVETLYLGETITAHARR